MQVRQQDMQADIQTAQRQHMYKMQEIEANALAKQMESQGKHQQRMTEQVNDAEANISQSNAAAEADLIKTDYKTESKLRELVTKAELGSGSLNNKKEGMQKMTMKTKPSTKQFNSNFEKNIWV